MDNQTRPVLSIGMIFKNEIRCLERCMKSLAPLRAAIPCELVMADTGATDGSREIAEKYADILFDFPWINDFAAARNAVVERCSGNWFLTLDADEWLDEDMSLLTAFLKSPDSKKIDVCTITIRNYVSEELADGVYTDMLGVRMARMDWSPRYEGAIHEYFVCPDDCKTGHLRQVVLHHDGYVMLNVGTEAGLAKQERNLTLLREELERNPDDLRTLSEIMDVGKDGEELFRTIRKAVSLVTAHAPGWEVMGPVIFGTAVAIADRSKFPEVEEWIQNAEDWFPNSLFTGLDVNFVAVQHYNRAEDYERVAWHGEGYLHMLEAEKAGHLDPKERMHGTLRMGSRLHEQMLKTALAEAYRNLGRAEDAISLLSQVETDCLRKETVVPLTVALMNLHVNSDLDTAPLMRSVWEGISAPIPTQAKAEERKAAFFNAILPSFSLKQRDSEKARGKRFTYTLLLPLRACCDLGRAAAMLETEDPQTLAQLLAEIEDWRHLPGQALARALEQGVSFPLPDRPLNLEETDILAGRLAQETDVLPLLQQATEGGSWQAATWARGLALAAVRVCKWKDEEQNLALARAFAAAERQFLALCYTPEALAELRPLPSLHRFGWHCTQAFDALDSGDLSGYARHLRQGLAACEDMKPMVKFLTEKGLPQPSPELLELAKKVRGMLSLYPADDPAVTALKASPVYQRVAHLIEGPEGEKG